MLSELQKRVFQRKLSGMSYSQIIANEPALNCNRQVACCLRRSALRLPWDEHYGGGADPYLAAEDEEALMFYIEENAEDMNCLTTWEVIEAAHAVKTWRNEEAVRELLACGCDDLAGSIQVKPEPPSRAWVNAFCGRRGFAIKKRREIEASRLKAGFYDDLAGFLNDVKDELRDTPPELIFNCDETMLSAKRQYKGVVPEGMTTAIGTEQPERQHMTAMLTVCAGGAKVPLFVILTGLQNLPDSLKRLSSRCWVASSSTGWMTKYLFCDYVVNFCHWLTHYRATLPPDMQSRTAFLFLDGHSTRLNPGALEYLRRFNVKAITLPAHSTHILQPVDVGIAGPFKDRFKKSLLRGLSSIDNGRDALRAATVWAALDAYETVVTTMTSEGAFARAGIKPCSPEPLTKNPYVRPGRSPYTSPQRGFEVNRKVLTNHVEDIWGYLRDKRPSTDSTMMMIDPSIQLGLSRARHLKDGRLFTPYHSLLKNLDDEKLVNFS